MALNISNLRFFSKFIILVINIIWIDPLNKRQLLSSYKVIELSIAILTLSNVK